jgi:hypothetical protein
MQSLFKGGEAILYNLNVWAMASRVDCTVKKKADIHTSISYFMSGPPDNRCRLLRWDAGQEHYCAGSWPLRHSSQQYSQVSTLKQTKKIICMAN